MQIPYGVNRRQAERFRLAEKPAQARQSRRTHHAPESRDRRPESFVGLVEFGAGPDHRRFTARVIWAALIWLQRSDRRTSLGSRARAFQGSVQKLTGRYACPA